MGRKKKEKLTTKQIMDIIIDKDLLKKTKAITETSDDKYSQDAKINVETNKKKWFETPMLTDNFLIVNVKDKFYVRYSEWKNNIFTGPYKTESETNMVIDMYVRETKKPNPFDRKLENIHSVLMSI